MSDQRDTDQPQPRAVGAPRPAEPHIDPSPIDPAPIDPAAGEPGPASPAPASPAPVGSGPVGRTEVDDEPTVVRAVTRPRIEDDEQTVRFTPPDVGESTVRLSATPATAPIIPSSPAAPESVPPGPVSAAPHPVASAGSGSFAPAPAPAGDRTADHGAEDRSAEHRSAEDHGVGNRSAEDHSAEDRSAGDRVGAEVVPVDEGGHDGPGERADRPGPDERPAVPADPASPGTVTSAQPEAAGAQPKPQVAPWRRLSSAGSLIWVLIALFGFTLVVQLRSNDTDQGLAATRQEDLVGILSDLEARETRLNAEIASLEESQRQLNSGVEGGEAALAEAARRANELGLLAGTLPGRGPGLEIKITAGTEPIRSSAILNTVQELRGAGGEVMQLAGADGTAVRVVASSAFVDADGAVVVDGVRLTGPYTLMVIGAPQTMDTALRIPGGVVASVEKDGGTVIPLQRKTVEVTAVRKAKNLQYARPVS